MRNYFKNPVKNRFLASYLLVVVLAMGIPYSASAAISASIKANNTSGSITINQGSSFTYSWDSTDATLCNITAPNGPSAITLSGSGVPIDPTHPWYPTASSSVTLTLDCTNGTTTASDSVVINLSAVATSSPSVTADIKANGSDGPVTITNGDNFNYSWASTNATLCNITAPNGPSAITLSGSGNPISLGHPWYPAVGGSTTLTLDCTNGVNTASDSVVINVVATTTPPVNPPGNGGGGGGGGGGSSRPPTPDSGSTNPGQVLGASTVSDFCPYLKSYLRIGRANDTFEVIKLQAFLKTFEGYDYVTISGVFDEATLQAVNAFQLKYQSEVLTPWGISAPTGYVYITTLGKINKILCGTGIPAVKAAVYKAPVVKDKVQPCNCPCTCQMSDKEGSGNATTSISSAPIIGTGSSPDKGQIKDNHPPETLGAAIFSWPETITEIFQCLYELILILVVLYVLGAVLENVLYKDTLENIVKRHRTKWLTMSLGSLAAAIIAYLAGEYCLIFPLIIAFLACLVRTFIVKKVTSSPVL